jgi:hypothetical protein
MCSVRRMGVRPFISVLNTNADRIADLRACGQSC